MAASFREFLRLLGDHDELLEISAATDLRNVAALVPQADKALLFTNLIGYEIPVASGLLQSRNRMSLALGVPYDQIGAKLQRAMEHPIAPRMVKDAPVKDVIATAREGGPLQSSRADLFAHGRRSDDYRSRDHCPGSGIRDECRHVSTNAQ